MSYKIIIPLSVEWKIDSIYSYILNSSSSKETATKFIHKFMEAIVHLDEMPQRNPIYFKSKLCSMEELRRMIFENYEVFYKIDEENNCVEILEIKHQSQNQMNFSD